MTAQFALRLLAGATLALAVLLPSGARAQGIVLPGVGPVNASFGGAGTAAPLDATGALHWNPAVISALQNEVDIGVELLSSRNDVSSSVPAGAFGSEVPQASLGGTSRNDSGMSPLPAIAAIYRPEGSPLTVGLSLITIGGFYVNFPASATNPLFTPPPPNGIGLGGVYSRLDVLQIAPTVAADLGSGLSVGIAPTVDVADLQLSADPFVAPNVGSTSATYPQAYQARLRYGMGFQLGVFYQTDLGVNLGFSYKSPQWFEPFTFYSSDAAGNLRSIRNNVTYPMIFSWGVSYTGTERLVVAADLRYILYSDTEGFGGSPTVGANGALGGLGWRDVFFLGLGIQYKITDWLTARAGYTYNQNPVPAADAFFSVAAPGVFEHGLDLGVTVRLNQTISLSAAWVHAFSNSITGPYQTAQGPVPGTRVQLEQTTDSAIAGLTIHY